MSIKAILILVIILFFTAIGIGVNFHFITIGFAPSLATFVLGVLGIGAFLLSAGAVLPRDGRSGLTTMAIGGTLLLLGVLSALTITIV